MAQQKSCRALFYTGIAHFGNYQDVIILAGLLESSNAIAAVFSITTPDQNGVTVTTTVDTAPYVLRRDTTGVANGSNRVFANAEDIYGNTRVVSTSVTVAN